MSKETISFIKKLQGIQCNLRAPKGQKNKFGNYDYRSAEDILGAIKPLLAEYNLAILITDRIEMKGDFMFNVSKVTLLDCDTNQETSVEGWAMHSESKKGMDSAQISGSTASYSLKRALGNLFAIDNEKDADATNRHGSTNSTPDLSLRLKAIQGTKTMEDLISIWKAFPKEIAAMPQVIAAKDKQKQKLENK